MSAPLDYPMHIVIPATALTVLSIWFFGWFLTRGFFHWLRLRRIDKAIRALAKNAQLDAFDKVFLKGGDRGTDKRLGHLWREFRETLHVQAYGVGGQEQPAAIRSTVPAEAYFNSQFVVDSRLTVEFFKHLPGIFTGIGIIGTFYGLITGLQQFKVSENATTVRASLEALMHSVGDAFLISATAIFLAMVVTFLEKLLLATLYGQTEQIAHDLDAHFVAGAGEEYLERLVHSSEESAAQSRILKDALVSELGSVLRELAAQQIATTETLQVQLAQRIDEAANRQVQASSERNGELVDAITSAIAESLKEPLQNIANSVQKASGDQSDAAIRMLTDVMSSFAGKLNDLFGQQIGEINKLNAGAAQAMTDAVAALQSLVTKLEQSGKQSTEVMAKQMATAIQTMEEAQRGINEQTRALLEKSRSDTQQALTSTLQSVQTHMTDILGKLTSVQQDAFSQNVAREKEMNARAGSMISGMNDAVESAAISLREASEKMAGSVSRLADVTTTSIDKLDAGAGKVNTAATAFAGAGDHVAEVMQRVAGVGENLTTLAGSLIDGSRSMAEALKGHREQRDATERLLAEVRRTIELARKEASLTDQALQCIEASAAKLAEAHRAADVYLAGISDVLAESNAAFNKAVLNTLGKVNRDFHEKLTAAVGMVVAAMEGFEEKLDAFEPPVRGRR